MSATVDRPVPVPVGLVVNPRSNARTRTSSGMPAPVSAAVSRTHPGSAADVARVNAPPPGMASPAFTARLIRI